MESILRHTDRAAGAGYRCLLLWAPLVLVGIPAVCGVAIGAVGFAAGMSPVEYASGFMLETAANLPVAVLFLTALAIVLGSAAGFALSCAGLSREKSRLFRVVLRAVSRCITSLFILRVFYTGIPHPVVTSLTDPALSSPRLRAAPTAAGLSGAFPLLN